MFNNLKIGLRLGLSFGAIIFLLLVILFLAISNLRFLNNEVTDMANDKFPKTMWANGIINQINIGARTLRNAALTNDPLEREKQINDALATTPPVVAYLDSLKRTIQTDEGKNLLAKLATFRNGYIDGRTKIINFLKQDSVSAAVEIMFGDFAISQNGYFETVTELIDYQANLMRKSSENANNTYNTANLLIFIIGGIAILLAILIALWITKSITKPINRAVIAADSISIGNTKVNLDTESKDETGMLLLAMKKMAGNIGNLVTELNKTADAAVKGKLDNRGDENAFQGDYKEIMKGFNATLDAVIGPLNVTAEYVDRISKGDIPPKITDNYNGDFNEIKNNLNGCIDAVHLLVQDAKMLSNAAKDGKLDTRADATKHGGDFRAIIQGVNDTLDNVIGPLNVAAEYVDRISKGDIPPKITDNYSGDFNEIKNNLNGCIDAVHLLVQDALMLVSAAEMGELSTRASEFNHHGDFRSIVEGVNKTLDMVVGPIDETSTVMAVYATGDLTTRIVNDYKGDFAKLKNDINGFAETLSDLLLQLTDSIQNTASAAHEISSTAESLAAASQEQSAQADEVANAVEAMSRTITENAMSASRTADVATKNSQMASESGKVVELTVNKMKDIAVVVKNSATNIEQLGESSKQIGEIISVIDDIADQTNLLALNAAIEAARAGEQGRGFAVVADEVRKLAERTTEATKQIAKMIKGIQHETEQAVVAMNRGTIEVQSGIELADKAGDSLKQILTSTHEVLDMVNQIAAASEEQSATSEEISKNVIAISKVTADSTSRVEDVAKTADTLASMTEQLRNLIASFKISNENKFYGQSTRMIASRDGRQLTSGR
jgi:methyl-accepting chemotaxis protein